MNIVNKINLYEIKLNIILYLYSPISISLSKTNQELEKKLIMLNIVTKDLGKYVVIENLRQKLP